MLYVCITTIIVSPAPAKEYLYMSLPRKVFYTHESHIISRTVNMVLHVYYVGAGQASHIYGYSLLMRGSELEAVLSRDRCLASS